MKVLKLKQLIFAAITFFSISHGYSKEAMLHFQLLHKDVSADYKSALANKLLLERTNPLENRLDVLDIRTNYHVLLFGLDVEKDKAIADFMKENFNPLDCGHINKNTIQEDSSDISAFDDLCVFPGSKMIFVILKNNVPDTIEIRDLKN